MQKFNEGCFTIVCFGRGRVLISEHWPECDSDGYFRLSSGATIRSWGTKHGIGQLQVSGPTSETKLDCIPFKIKIHTDAIHEELTCADSTNDLWRKAVREAQERMITM